MEIGGGTAKGGGGVVVSGGDDVGKIDPANLHLKKELTQIRKVARALRDPGTTSSWRSPVNSARSFQKHQYVRRHKNGQVEGNAATADDSSEQFLQVQSNASNQTNSNSNHGVDKGTVRVKGRENKVFLYNWKSQKSESEKSRQIGEDEVENSVRSVGVESLSDVRNGSGNDSKSDSCLSLGYSSAIFKCKDKDFTQSIRHAVKKKSKRGDYSSAGLRQNNENVQKHKRSGRYAKDVESLLRGNSVSLVGQSDDTEDYSNSEDLRRECALSPLVARLKKKALPRSTAQLLRSLRKDDDSVSYSTPALSTSSYNRYGVRNPSTAGSWDAATASLNDADDEVDDQMDLPGRQGCGISCWSRRSTPKSRGGYGSCCSPSLSDTLRRKGSSIFCRRHYRHRRGYSLGSNKMRGHSGSASQYRVPLLNSMRGGSSMGSGNSDDDLSTNIEEIDMEGLSRLDGRRWSSSCRSQEGLDIIASNQEMGEESSPENARSLSHKYKPMFFEELVGQNVVVQSVRSAISRGRIAPISLFQGPRGTGKTLTARIFAAALNCLTTEESKPCGVCRECSEFISGKPRYLLEVDGSNKKGISNIKSLLKSLPAVHPSVLSKFMVFVIDECHLLPSKSWLTFLQLLEKPLPHVVFILVTTDIDNMPRAILSRCQKHIFNKITSGDIVTRLIKIVADEKLDVESDALELIASNADGSLRDAETMLDQLSLFGKRITISLVNELIGVVSDEKLFDLLELAMSSNATETVLRARELLDSGVDPMVLMSQLATLIVDIIAGTYPNVGEKHDSFLGARSLSERELDRLRHALSLLSEAEKHLRLSNERSTWFTATLLQLGSMPSPDQSHSGGSSRRQSSKATGEDLSNNLREGALQKQRIDTHLKTEESSSRKSFSRSSHRDSTSKDNTVSRTDAVTSDSNPSQSQLNSDEVFTDSRGDGNSRTSLRCVNSKILTDIWLQCIEKCHSKTLRQLLLSQGQLVSVSEAKGSFVAHIAFGDRYVKTRAEGFLSSITNAFEIVLQRNVEVKIILLPNSLGQKQMGLENQLTHLNTGNCVSEGSTLEAPVKRINLINHEQRLETAWVQAMEKGTPGSTNRSKPERNQVLPQDNACPPLNELELVNSASVPSQQWENELNHNVSTRILTNGVIPAEDQFVKGINHRPISPSLLHNSSFATNFSGDAGGYESGTTAPGCLCWNRKRMSRRRQAKKGTHLRVRKHGRLSWFGSCVKSPRKDNTRHKR